MSRAFRRRLVVTGPLDDYTREIASHPVTFTCQECGHQETREQLHGPKPRYCAMC